MEFEQRSKGLTKLSYDLPPSQNALPLPITSGRQADKRTPHQPNPERQRKYPKNGNDAPRAFRRLMAYAQGRKTRPGLDDGEVVSIRKQTQEAVLEVPRMKPGEDLRSFSARVDAALPVTGLATKVKIVDGKDLLGLKVQRTRKERKMHKLYDQWRAEEQKIRAKREEQCELAAEREMDPDTTSLFSEAGFGDVDGSKKRRRLGKEQDDDPWLELIRKRGEAKIGLHDVAQAPPENLHKQTRKQLQVGGAVVDVDNVPKTAGSLHRREELRAARDNAVEAYKKIKQHEQARLNLKKKIN